MNLEQLDTKITVATYTTVLQNKICEFYLQGVDSFMFARSVRNKPSAFPDTASTDLLSQAKCSLFSMRKRK